jgi:predicted methyltransferase
MGPLLTRDVHEAIEAARRAGRSELTCSLDLGRSTTTITLGETDWLADARHFPYLDKCKERTVYHWTGSAFEPVARYSTALFKLVPTQWGAPTFEIDGIKMLPSETISPYDDARRKVALIEPRGKVVLDTCAGLGYFAAACIASGAARIFSFEKNPDVLWLRSLNPWSPVIEAASPLMLQQGDVTEHIGAIGDASVDAVLHDPPRFGIAGELYSQQFYDQLARVLKPRGKLFHYTGKPNALTSGRDVPREVAARLEKAGFVVKAARDGLLASKRGGSR